MRRMNYRSTWTRFGTPNTDATPSKAASALVAVLTVCAACNQTRPSSPSNGAIAPTAGARPASLAANSAQPGKSNDGETPEQVPLTDEAIEAAVQRELYQSSAVSGPRIDVTVSSGIVTLTGTVANLLARERAVRLAAAIRGVLSISDRLVVVSMARADSALRQDILDALKADPASDSYEVMVDVSNQAVTLRGTVDSFVEKAMAERLAKSITGVEKVDNQLLVSYELTRTDEEIEPDVKAKLYWDALVDDQFISAAVDNGYVTLNGTVGSLAEKYRARDDAWVPGVRGVNELPLQVHWTLNDKNRRPQREFVKSDSEVEGAITDALAYDPRVSGTGVKIKVSHGHVALEGTVATLRARHVAGEIASNTTGARGVDNQLDVAVIKPSEAPMVERRIEQQLARNPLTDGYAIGVDVAPSGNATLSGYVTTQAERAEAESVASSVAGVQQVDNQIEVRYPKSLVRRPYSYPYYPYVSSWESYRLTKPLKSDAQLRQDVEDQLFWSPFVDADQVKVAVSNGNVTLRGTVDSWQERNAGSDNAFEAGALSVNNELTVGS